MPITGLSHITFVVRDLERSKTLWCDGLGAQVVYDSADKTFSLSKEKFFMLAGVWIAVMEGEPSARTYRHVAFQMPESEITEYETRDRALGVEVLPARTRVPGEGKSLYFYDFDNNLLELHSGTLDERIRAYGQLCFLALRNQLS